MMFARPERLSDAWYDAAADEFARVFATPAAGSRSSRLPARSTSRRRTASRASGSASPRSAARPSSSGAIRTSWSRPASRRIGAGTPAARSIVLEDCGHVPQFEHPGALHRLVRDFLGRQIPS
jgi:pimeloyl-ACP methyl ester carboxylesterase